jgi:hypothetical protein
LQILAIDNSHEETLLRFIRLLQHARQHERALKYARRAVEAYPDHFELNLLLADSLR